MSAWKKLTNLLSVIPLLFCLVLLLICLTLLISAIYMLAYVAPIFGLLMVVAGGLAHEPVYVLFGIVVGGFGGIVYKEWFVRDLGGMPTLTELPEFLLDFSEKFLSSE